MSTYLEDATKHVSTSELFQLVLNRHEVEAEELAAARREVEARYTEAEVRWVIREAAEGALDDLAPTPDSLLNCIRASRDDQR